MGGFALGKPDALVEFFDVFAFDSSFYFGEIGFGDAIFWVGQAVGEVVIIGEDNQARCVEVEPANTEDSMACGDEVDGFGPALWVKIGADDAFGFIEKEINLGLVLNSLAVGFYGVRIDVREGGDGIDYFAIYGDAAFEDYFLAFSA